jgi:hypothetical protein
MVGLSAFMTIKGVQRGKYEYSVNRRVTLGTKRTIIAVVRYTKWYAKVRNLIFATTFASLIVMACRRSMVTGELEQIIAVFGPTTKQLRWSCAPSWAKESLRVLDQGWAMGVGDWVRLDLEETTGEVDYGGITCSVGHLTSCDEAAEGHLWMAQGFWSFLKAYRRGTNAESGRALVFLTALVHFAEAVLLGLVSLMGCLVALSVSLVVLLGWFAQKLIMKFSLWCREATPGDLNWLQSCPPNTVGAERREQDLQEGILVLAYASEGDTDSTDRSNGELHSADPAKSPQSSTSRRRPKYSRNKGSSSQG